MSFIQNLIHTRQERKLSLQDVANLSGVSKSMLSKIEREEKNPTLQIAAQIAEGLGLTLSAMLGEAQGNPVVYLRPDDQLTFQDECSGFTRILLSPAFKTKGIEFILNKIPVGQRSALFPPHQQGVRECVHLTQGSLQVVLDGTEYDMNVGDSLFYEASVPHQFVNTGPAECLYYIVIDSHGIGM